jgi:tetratricopeptide (TPR) repeat protein
VSRTAWYKLGYLIALLAAGVFAWWLSLAIPRWGLWIALGLCLVPGRVQGWMWREFFRGRRLCVAEEWATAEVEFETFLQRLHRQPWLRHGIWLGGAVYTRSIEAMTWNNLGAIRLNSGATEQAEVALRKSLAIDSNYPIPYWNLALLRMIENRPEEATESAAAALRLGYSGGTGDRLISEAGQLLARIEGRGRTNL